MNIPTCITLTARSLREGPSPRDCFLDSTDPLAAVLHAKNQLLEQVVESLQQDL